MAEKKATKTTAKKSATVTQDTAKKKALDEAISQIEKQFGMGSIMKLGDEAGTRNVEVIPTGCLALDIALGIGGVPRGRVVEIYGPESSGKTTLTLHIIAQAQKLGGTAAFIDAEHALDPVYASKLGVDLNELYVSQPDSGEQALEICEAIARSSAVDVIVIDSVAALTPKVEIDGGMGDSHVGLLARLMSQGLRKLASIINKSNTCVIFINQLRDKIGGGLYGPNETTTGGKALKFFSSVRMDVRRSEQLKDSTEAYGNRTKVKIVKNKLAPPFKLAEFDILYGKGISMDGSIFDIAVQKGIVEKSGSWFSYNGEKLGQGKENAKQALNEADGMMAEIEAKIYEMIAAEKEEAFAKSRATKKTKVVEPAPEVEEEFEDEE